MSWFSKKKVEPPRVEPPPPPQLSASQLAENERIHKIIEHGAEWVNSLKQKFDICLHQRATELQACGLPVPQVDGELSHTCDRFLTLRLSFPRLAYIPPHFVVHSRSAIPPPPNQYYSSAAYVVTGTEEAVRAAGELYKQQGIIELVRKHRGIWVNQDPYDLYDSLALTSLLNSGSVYHEILGLDEEQLAWALRGMLGNTSFNTRTAQYVPLERLRDYTPDDLRQMERRVSFYNALSDRTQKYSFESVCGYPKSRPSKIPKEFNPFPNKVLFCDLPEPVFKTTLITFKVITGDPVRPNVAREFLDSIRSITHPIAFEVIDDGVTVYFQLVCTQENYELIEHQLELHFPTSAVIKQDNTAALPQYFITANPPAIHADTRVLSEFPLDPLTQFFSVLNKQKQPLPTALQVLCFPVPNETMNLVADALKSSIPREDPKAVMKKMPAWQAKLCAFSSNRQTLEQLRTSFFSQYATPQYAWTFSDVQEGQLSERDMSEWALLSTAELAALAHFPIATIDCDRLEKASMKSKLPPDLFATGEIHVGTSEARGQTKPVYIPDSVRARHLYVVGKSGSGKSTLITNIARQDIERGDGVCVIDPHGDLVSDLLDYIPEHRVKDVIYFNVSDRAHPIGLDMMSAVNEAEIELLTDDLITTFRRLTETWGERMETILRYSFNTLLRTPGATLLDLQKLLTNEGWRSTVVRKINFAPLVEFWFNLFPNMPKDAAHPILSRMTKIVLSPTLNAIFGQSQSTLNFNDVIRNRKILLVNLGGDSRDQNNEQLAVSDEMKKLIGSVVVSQLQLAAMRQASIPEAARVPCRFFVDEFQNFVSGAFPKILSEARKYKLCLTVAHQYISQLDDATRNAVFGNVGTMIVMPLGQKDANYLGAELGAYSPEDVANLAAEKHEALCRPTTKAADTFLFTTLPPKPITQSFAHTAIAHSRAEYAAELEATKPATSEAAGAAGDTSLRTKRPERAAPQAFGSTGEKILHFISLVGYLTTSQIIELCFAHLSDASKRPAASRDLKKLTDSKRLKSTNYGDGKVFYIGGQCNPSAHNVAVRDMLIKILQSGYEITEVNLSPAIGALSPDLLISFLCADGSMLPTYWEYDTGTEGITEILKKIARYVPYSGIARIVFITSTRERMQSLMKATQADFVEFAVLNEFATLDAPAFVSAAYLEKYSFF